MRLTLTLMAAITPALVSCHAAPHRSGPGGAGQTPAPSASATATYGHDVYFWLTDESRADALVAGCQTLAGIPGVEHLSVGTRDGSQLRDVNEQTFHVALHVEFDSVESYASYGPHPLHQALLDEFGALFERVQVFDSDLAQ